MENFPFFPTYTDMTGLLSPALEPTPSRQASPSVPQPRGRRYGRRRARARRHHHQEQNRIQQEGNEAVLKRLDKIADTLEFLADRAIGADVPNRKETTAPASACSCEQYTICENQSVTQRSESPGGPCDRVLSNLPPFPHAIYPWHHKKPFVSDPRDTEEWPALSQHERNSVDDDGKKKEQSSTSEACTDFAASIVNEPSASFFLLEMELNMTRDRLRYLRETADTAPIEIVRDAVRQLTYGLEEAISADLDRLRIINDARERAFLSDQAGFTAPAQSGTGSVPGTCFSEVKSEAGGADSAPLQMPRSGSIGSRRSRGSKYGTPSGSTDGTAETGSWTRVGNEDQAYDSM
ncbi:Uu.00g078670.m01.CDS01 [Anthostomella pinea]|uniref:Uu.00g078670.m01.CDS01 n=1 Tax=Anthostomella pinea TaxID=933095 RepID=A0AAI8VKM8_9PEZI|nr:Uu.00g078670.m01.CDS01 [Anthostomella pinea]